MTAHTIFDASRRKQDRTSLTESAAGGSLRKSQRGSAASSLNRQWFKLQTLLFIFGIDDYGYRSIVDQRNRHVRPELTGRH